MSLFPFGVPFTDVPRACAQTPRFPSPPTIEGWQHHLPAGCGDQDLLRAPAEGVSDTGGEETARAAASTTWLKWFQPFSCSIFW